MTDIPPRNFKEVLATYRKAAAEMRLAGLTYREIGEKLGVEASHAWRWVAESGVSIPGCKRGVKLGSKYPRAETAERLRIMRESRLAGLTYKAIGEKLGVSRQYIQQVLKISGLTDKTA